MRLLAERPLGAGAAAQLLPQHLIVPARVEAGDAEAAATARLRRRLMLSEDTIENRINDIRSPYYS